MSGAAEGQPAQNSAPQPSPYGQPPTGSDNPYMHADPSGSVPPVAPQGGYPTPQGYPSLESTPGSAPAPGGYPTINSSEPTSPPPAAPADGELDEAALLAQLNDLKVPSSGGIPPAAPPANPMAYPTIPSYPDVSSLGDIQIQLHCTNDSSPGVPKEQHMWQCATCGYTDDKYVCDMCAVNCHSGHQLTNAGTVTAFCSCGVECTKCKFPKKQ